MVVSGMSEPACRIRHRYTFKDFYLPLYLSLFEKWSTLKYKNVSLGIIMFVF